MLEETFGPRGYRELRAAMPGEEGRRLLDDLARLSVDQMHALDDVMQAWRRARPQAQAPAVAPPRRGLSPRELIEGFVELKQSEAEVLREVAREAPAPEIREKLERLAIEQEEAAERLQRFL